MPAYSSDRNSNRSHHYDRQARQARRRRRALRRRMRILCAVALTALTATAAMALIDRQPMDTMPYIIPAPQALAAAEAPAPVADVIEVPQEPEAPQWEITHTGDTAQIRADFPSQYGILLELETGKVLAARDSKASISPASMTKILTLLTAAEHVTEEQLANGTFTMTRAVADYTFSNNCSVVGYEVDEVIPVRELFYGCILSSGADACMGLAETIFGSHEAMVTAMNLKARELGLSSSAYFTNCVGLYDENLRCTVEDIAIVLKAALENDLCRQVMTTSTFESIPTAHHTQGQVLTNLFTHRIQKQDTGSVTVSAAKTGYVSESGFCAASFGTTPDGTGYICVTGKSTGTNQSIRDHAELYRTYCPQFP